MLEEFIELLLHDTDSTMVIVKGYIKKYKPLVYELLQEIVEVYKDYANNTEFFAIMAKSKKNMYDAYVNAGFTEDQALALMINDNIQLMKNIKKSLSNTNSSSKSTFN